MAKGLYIGINGVARRVKKIYLGVNGVARCVKSAYLGVNGVARKIYNLLKITITKHPELRFFLEDSGYGDHTCNDDYVLGSAGVYDGAMTNKVTAYNSSGTEVSCPTLSSKRFFFMANKAGSYALFAGGNTSTTASSTTVNAYNNSLTRSSPTVLGQNKTEGYSASFNGYAVFAGGYNVYKTDSSYFTDYNNCTITGKVYAYNSSLTRSNPSDISNGGNSAPYSTKHHLYFRNGTYGLEAYDSSFVKSSITLSYAKTNARRRGFNNYFIAAGGYVKQSGDYTNYNSMSVVNSSNTEILINNAMSYAGYNYNTILFKNYIAFFEGYHYYYDSSTSKWKSERLSTYYCDVFNESLTREVLPKSPGGSSATLLFKDYSVSTGGSTYTISVQGDF